MDGRIRLAVQLRMDRMQGRHSSSGQITSSSLGAVTNHALPRSKRFSIWRFDYQAKPVQERLQFPLAGRREIIPQCSWVSRQYQLRRRWQDEHITIAHGETGNTALSDTSGNSGFQLPASERGVTALD
jgi:hypothetical protein